MLIWRKKFCKYNGASETTAYVIEFNKLNNIVLNLKIFKNIIFLFIYFFVDKSNKQKNNLCQKKMLNSNMELFFHQLYIITNELNYYYWPQSILASRWKLRCKREIGSFRKASSSINTGSNGISFWSSLTFLIFGQRPSCNSFQSRDLRGLPTFPLRSGGAAGGVVLLNLFQSCSHTKLPAFM